MSERPDDPVPMPDDEPLPDDDDEDGTMFPDENAPKSI